MGQKHIDLTPSVIRAWAVANGIVVGVRGRISAALREQYVSANK